MVIFHSYVSLPEGMYHQVPMIRCFKAYKSHSPIRGCHRLQGPIVVGEEWQFNPYYIP